MGLHFRGGHQWRWACYFIGRDWLSKPPPNWMSSAFNEKRARHKPRAGSEYRDVGSAQVKHWWLLGYFRPGSRYSTFSGVRKVLKLKTLEGVSGSRLPWSHWWSQKWIAPAPSDHLSSPSVSLLGVSPQTVISNIRRYGSPTRPNLPDCGRF